MLDQKIQGQSRFMRSYSKAVAGSVGDWRIDPLANRIVPQRYLVNRRKGFKYFKALGTTDSEMEYLGGV